MKIYIKKIHNSKGVETGSIISASVDGPTNIQQKTIIENKLIQYGFDVLYPGQGLNIFRDMYVDTPSVTIIRDINNLPNTEDNI
ncbi:MAG: hypothetical protein AB7P01_11750 [Bacteroidia bacterium]